MDLLQFPVKLVIKAPNQKFADHTVDCDHGWTIAELKKHLADTYPNKPREELQKIIYSGKLLHDSVVLKDVLRQYEPEQTTHTVHLVCSGPCAESSTTSPASGSAPGLRNRRSATDTSPSPSSQPSASQSPSSNVSSSTQQAASTPPVNRYQQHYGANQMYDPAMMYQGNMAAQAQLGATIPFQMPGMFPYSPEQMMWMQQMYAQQMAQYMQYFQPAGMDAAQAGDALGPAVHAHVPGVAADPAAAVDPVAVAAAANQRVGEANQQVRMNAGGGAPIDEDEDEGNRDWLDWLYTLSRFAVLLSIVYFYSTLGRFMMVFGLFVFVYLYQTGWLLRRRQRPVVIDRPEAEEEQNQQNEAQQEDRGEDEAEEAGGEGQGEGGEEAVPPAAPPQPSGLAVALSFFVSFFTSLLPQPPVAVNAN